MEKIYCPYCGSEHFHLYEKAQGNKEDWAMSRIEGKEYRLPLYDRYECEECEWLFDEEDIDWQELRHAISHYLIDTDEEHPIVFRPNEMPVIGENWPETYGLSTLEMSHLESIFQIPGDGTIWFHLEGEYEGSDFLDLDRAKPLWHDLEEQNFLIVDDLREILLALESLAR